MPDFHKKGIQTPRTPIYKSESHKLHHSFEVADGVIIYPGYPVFIDATGKLITDPTAGRPFIGIAVTGNINPCYTHEPIRVTVMVRGYIIITGCAAAALAAGTVLEPTTATTSTPFRFNFQAATGGDNAFIALSEATEVGDEIFILVK